MAARLQHLTMAVIAPRSEGAPKAMAQMSFAPGPVEQHLLICCSGASMGNIAPSSGTR
jgi:hypothetical protein